MKIIKALKSLILKLPTSKLVFFIGLLPSIGMVFLYQYFLIEIPGTEFLYKLGLIIYGILNSIIAASFFYFISQYISVDIPQKRLRIKTISILHQYYRNIDVVVNQIIMDIGYENKDIKDLNELRRILSHIDVNSSIHGFQDWYKYFYHKKLQLMELTRSTFYFHHYIDENTSQELLILDKNLMDVHLFSGYKILTNRDLSFADITLQEIFIHNLHLQQCLERERLLFAKELEEDGKRYRKEHYS